MNIEDAFERRRIVRVPVDEPVSFLVVGRDDVREGVARDVGIGGAFIETADPAPFHAIVRVGIELGGERFVLQGVVRWIRASGMGIQFGSLGVHETRAIIELARAASPSSSRDVSACVLPPS